MIMTTPILQSGAQSTMADGGVRPKNTAEAARQFEALLVQQMLQSARTGGGGWGTEDEAGAPMTDMAEQQFAQLLANGGGLGLAKLVAEGLNRR